VSGCLVCPHLVTMTNTWWLYLPLPKLRIRSRGGSLVRTSREVSDRTLLRVVLTEPDTNPAELTPKPIGYLRARS
jgi:hypothetical protein